MAKQPNAAVRKLCVEIADAEADDDYESVLEQVNKCMLFLTFDFLAICCVLVIKLNPKDVPVQRCKLVALIQLDQLDEALEMIMQPPPQLGCVF